MFNLFLAAKMISLTLLWTATCLIPFEAPGLPIDDTPVERGVMDLVQQLRTTISTGKFPRGLRVRLEAHLIKTADAAGPSKNRQEYWEFTGKRLYCLEPKNTGNNLKWIKRESRSYDQKQLVNILLQSNFQTIGQSEDEGLGTLLAGSEFNLGDRSIQFIVDGKIILELGESCVGATFSPKDSIRFAKLYENLINLTGNPNSKRSKPDTEK